MTTSDDRDMKVKVPRTDSELVDALVNEARAEWVPNSVSDDHEQRLLARIAAAEADTRLRLVRGSGSGIWAPLAAITAVAAGVAFFMHPHGGDVSSSDGDTVAVRAAPAPASLMPITGAGVVRVDGVAVRAASLREGQKVESEGGVANFVAPGRVDWVLESGTVVAVERSGGHGGAIVLGLAMGAVEAQVTPVPMGEAFAVDVDGVRVAVHGTHLRVARDGAHVVVDLSEGIISVGTPPKTGSTYGTLVTAPAHVEFSTVDVTGTLRVDHEESHVRPPVDLAESIAPVAVASPQLGPSVASVDEGDAVDPVEAPPLAPSSIQNPRPPSGITTPPPPKPPTPTEIVTAAVSACAEQTLRSGGAAAITVSSVLTVNVNSDGVARLATFDPPLAPDLQSCISRAVYATHWTEPGPHHIPIELHL